jgi:hypothetical protein
MTLSRRARVSLRNFLAFWTGRKRYRTPHAVLEAMQAEREARARNDCRKVGEARRRVRQARLDGLSLETYGRHWRTQ